mgnify:CR=1 FL=1
MLEKFIGDRAFYRKLFMVMTPVLVQNVITNFVSLLDNIMVGQVGTEPMSGVAIVNQLLFVFNLCIFGGLAGAGIFTAQFYGKSDKKGLRDSVRAKYYIATAAVLLCLGIFLVYGEELIGFFLHEGQEDLDLNATLGYGMGYMRVMLLSTVPFAVMQVYGTTLRETGETFLPMKAGIIAVLVNLVGNYILIFGKLGAPAMGVVGAAWATVLARIVECLIVVIWTHRHRERNPFIVGLYRSPKIPGKLAKRMLITGSPLLINEVLWSTGMTMMNQCYSMRGLEAVSAVNIASTISNLFFCAFFAMGTTISIIIGQLLGAGEIERAIDEDRKLIAFAVTLCTAVGVVMAVLAPLIPRIYNTSGTVKEMASRMLLVSAAMMPLHAFVNGSYFTLRSGGRTVITFLFDSGFLWTVNVLTAYLLSRLTGFGVVTMFLIVELLNLIKASIGYVLLKNRSWAVKLV